jgi:hypothetical protein
VVNKTAFTVDLRGDAGRLTGSYAGEYGAVTAADDGDGGSVLSGTLDGLGIGTPTQIPVGNGVIIVVAATPPATALGEAKGFY